MKTIYPNATPTHLLDKPFKVSLSSSCSATPSSSSSSSSSSGRFPCQWQHCYLRFDDELSVYHHVIEKHAIKGKQICLWHKSLSDKTHSSCGTHFLNKGNFIDHVSSHFSTKLKPYFCEFCPASFRNRQELRQHEVKLHDIQYGKREYRKHKMAKLHVSHSQSCPTTSHTPLQSCPTTSHTPLSDSSTPSPSSVTTMSITNNHVIQENSSLEICLKKEKLVHPYTPSPCSLSDKRPYMLIPFDYKYDCILAQKKKNGLELLHAPCHTTLVPPVEHYVTPSAPIQVVQDHITAKQLAPMIFSLLKQITPICEIGLSWQYFTANLELLQDRMGVVIPSIWFRIATNAKERNGVVSPTAQVEFTNWMVYAEHIEMSRILEMRRMRFAQRAAFLREKTVASMMTMLSDLRQDLLELVQKQRRNWLDGYDMSGDVFINPYHELATRLLKLTWKSYLAWTNEEKAELVEISPQSRQSRRASYCKGAMVGMKVHIRYQFGDAALTVRKECFKACFSVFAQALHRVLPHMWGSKEETDLIRQVCCRGSRCGEEVMPLPSYDADAVPLASGVKGRMDVVDQGDSTLIVWLKLGTDATWASLDPPSPQEPIHLLPMRQQVL